MDVAPMYELLTMLAAIYILSYGKNTKGYCYMALWGF